MRVCCKVTNSYRHNVVRPDITLVLQQNRLRRYGNVLQKKDDDWVKKCIEYEVKGSKARGKPKRTWTEVWKRTVKHVS